MEPHFDMSHALPAPQGFGVHARDGKTPDFSPELFSGLKLHEDEKKDDADIEYRNYII
jgi:hypothetical protein